MSCGKNEEYTPPESSRELVPEAGSSDQENSGRAENRDSASKETPLVRLGSDEVLINAITLNLDYDSSDEQILVIKSRSNPEEKISVAVADFSNVSNEYIRSWTGLTSASSIRSFQVYLDDLIGDRNSEIVCTGIDSEGRTTLDVFWRQKQSMSGGLEYLPICSIQEYGTIEIQTVERSRSYEAGLKDGISYSILTTTESTGKDGSRLLIESAYFWDFSTKQYVKLNEREIQNSTVEQKQLSAIYNGNEDDFFNYLAGPWYTESENGSELIAFFDVEEKSVTFFQNDIQETFSCVNSYKVLSNQLYLFCRNSIITYFENEIYVRIKDLNDIVITVKDIDTHTRTKTLNDIWSRHYIRMDQAKRLDQLAEKSETVRSGELPKLSGQYVNDSGDIIEFFGSSFRMRSNSEDLSGGFSVYQVDRPVMDLKIVDKSGIVTSTRCFSIDFTENRKDNSIVRNLTLTPGIVSIYGFKAMDNDYFRFTQIETLERSDLGM